MKNKRKGFIAIIAGFLVPVICALLYLMVRNFGTPFERNAVEMSAKDAALTAASNYIDRIDFSKQSTFIRRKASIAFNNLIKANQQINQNAISMTRQQVQYANGSSTSYSPTGLSDAVKERYGDLHNVLFDRYYKAVDPDADETIGITSDGKTISKGSGGSRVIELVTNTSTTSSSDIGNLTVSEVDADKLLINVTYKGRKNISKNYKVKAPELNCDIVFGIPTNYRACTADNKGGDAMGTATNSPIYQIGQACRRLMQRILSYRGCAVGIVPYSGKVSWPGGSLATQSHGTYKYSDYPAVNPTIPVAESYRFTCEGVGKTLSGSAKTISGAFITGIMHRSDLIKKAHGTTSTYYVEDEIDEDKILDLMTNDTKFMTYPLRISYSGYSNILAGYSNGVLEFWPNPYPIVGVTETKLDPFRIFGTFFPYKDTSNKSSFGYLPIIFGASMLNDSALNGGFSITYSGYTYTGKNKKRKKALILFTNQDDTFEKNDLTYLGFSNDASHVSMIDGDRFDALTLDDSCMIQDSDGYYYAKSYGITGDNDNGYYTNQRLKVDLPYKKAYIKISPQSNVQELSANQSELVGCTCEKDGNSLIFKPTNAAARRTTISYKVKPKPKEAYVELKPEKHVQKLAFEGNNSSNTSNCKIVKNTDNLLRFEPDGSNNKEAKIQYTAYRDETSGTFGTQIWHWKVKYSAKNCSIGDKRMEGDYSTKNIAFVIKGTDPVLKDAYINGTWDLSNETAKVKVENKYFVPDVGYSAGFTKDYTTETTETIKGTWGSEAASIQLPKPGNTKIVVYNPTAAMLKIYSGIGDHGSIGITSVTAVDGDKGKVSNEGGTYCCSLFDTSNEVQFKVICKKKDSSPVILKTELFGCEYSVEPTQTGTPTQLRCRQDENYVYICDPSRGTDSEKDYEITLTVKKATKANSWWSLSYCGSTLISKTGSTTVTSGGASGTYTIPKLYNVKLTFNHTSGASSWYFLCGDKGRADDNGYCSQEDCGYDKDDEDGKWGQDHWALFVGSNYSSTEWSLTDGKCWENEIHILTDISDRTGRCGDAPAHIKAKCECTYTYNKNTCNCKTKGGHGDCQKDNSCKACKSKYDCTDDNTCICPCPIKDKTVTSLGDSWGNLTVKYYYKYKGGGVDKSDTPTNETTSEPCKVVNHQWGRWEYKHFTNIRAQILGKSYEHSYEYKNIVNNLKVSKGDKYYSSHNYTYPEGCRSCWNKGDKYRLHRLAVWTGNCSELSGFSCSVPKISAQKLNSKSRLFKKSISPTINFSGAYTKTHDNLAYGYNVIYIPRDEFKGTLGTNDSATISIKMPDMTLISVEWSNHLNGTEGCYSCDADGTPSDSSKVYYQPITTSLRSAWRDISTPEGSLYSGLLGFYLSFQFHSGFNEAGAITSTEAIYWPYTSSDIYTGEYSFIGHATGNMKYGTTFKNYYTPDNNGRTFYHKGYGVIRSFILPDWFWGGWNFYVMHNSDDYKNFQLEAYESTTNINRILLAGGYHGKLTAHTNSVTGKGYERDATAAIKLLTKDAITTFNNKYGTNGRIYVIKYRWNDTEKSNAKKDDTYANAYARYSADTPGDLNMVLRKIMVDIKKWAGYQEAKVVD